MATDMNVNSGSQTLARDSYHHPLPWETVFEPMTLPDMLARTVAHDPAAPFLHFLGRTYSYGDIFEQANRFALGLVEMGIEKCDRVGLFLPNVPIYASAYYGAMMAGATVVNFSPLYSVEELAWQVADSGTKVLVTVDAPELYKTAEAVLQNSELETLIVGKISKMLPLLTGLAMQLFKRGDIAKVPYGQYGDAIREWSDMLADWAWSAWLDGERYDLPKLDPIEDLALLQYTGGTTGRPKGAMLGHSQLSMNAQQTAALNPFGNPDRKSVV